MEKRFDLKRFGQELWSRDKARPIRSQLGDGLELLATGDVMVIDASGVEMFDFSFAEELFAKTVSTLKIEYPGRFVVVEGLAECARENLSQALESKNLFMIERRKGKLNLLGRVHEIDEATFAAIRSEGISAGELSRKLGVNLTAMNERLSKLANASVVRREKGSSASGREQYVYKVLA